MRAPARRERTMCSRINEEYSEVCVSWYFDQKKQGRNQLKIECLPNKQQTR